MQGAAEPDTRPPAAPQPLKNEEVSGALRLLGLPDDPWETPLKPGQAESAWTRRKAENEDLLENPTCKADRLTARDFLRELEAVRPTVDRIENRLAILLSLQRFEEMLVKDSAHQARHHLQQAHDFALKGPDEESIHWIELAWARFQDKLGKDSDLGGDPFTRNSEEPAPSVEALQQTASREEVAPPSPKEIIPVPVPVPVPVPPVLDSFLWVPPEGRPCQVFSRDTVIWGRDNSEFGHFLPDVAVRIKGHVPGDEEASKTLTGKISSRHFTVRRSSERIVLEDGFWNEEGRLKRSANGVWVDNERTTSVDLSRADGAILRVTMDTLGPCWRIRLPKKSEGLSTVTNHPPEALFFERVDATGEHVLILWGEVSLDQFGLANGGRLGRIPPGFVFIDEDERIAIEPGTALEVAVIDDL